MPPLVTLLSDFGSGSPYPAAMRAVLAAYGEMRCIDISHDVPPHDVRAGAYLLSTIVPFTPAGTVHVAVVDPGVGTSRRALIVVAGGQYFVGPDNGVLMPAARRAGAPRAPAAGRLAQGTPPGVLGAPAPEIVDLDLGTGRVVRGALVGEILYVDAFGNLITNIPASLLPPAGTRVMLRAGRRLMVARVSRTYGEAARGRLVVVPGSDGLVEIAVREGRASVALHASAGAPVRLGPAR